MNEKLLLDLINLQKEIKNTEEYKDVLLKNSLLENSDEVKLLSYKKDMAIVEYEDTLKHYNKNSNEVLSAEKVMAKSIYELNNHKLVKEYNASFAKLNNVYEEINQELFSFYKGVKK
ncbi:MAG: hypothetical protein WCS51_03055 [Bacilli bacterium]